MDPENISQWKWHLDLKLARCVVLQAREKGPVCAWSLSHDRVPLALEELLSSGHGLGHGVSG